MADVSTPGNDERRGDDELVLGTLNVLAEHTLTSAADSALLSLQAGLDIEWACIYFLRRNEGTFVRIGEYGELPAYAESTFAHPDLGVEDDPLSKCVTVFEPTVLQRAARLV